MPLGQCGGGLQPGKGDSMGEDPFDLQRFVTAQAPTFEIALVELRTDRKRSHWIWFIFPQLRGLGGSTTSHFYSR
jgi:uncharacterized protein (DUF1810 family)